MLPIENFRFRRRHNLSLEPGLLWQAYAPTVLREIVYGWSRGFIDSWLVRSLLSDSPNVIAVAFLLGVTTWLACWISSPLNELRAYWVQPPSTKVPFKQFFNQERYLRSTAQSATIMAVSLMVGALLAPIAEWLFCLIVSHKAMVASLGFLVAVYARTVESINDPLSRAIAARMSGT